MEWLAFLLPVAWCVLSESYGPADWGMGILMGMVAWGASRVLLPTPKSTVRLRLFRLIPVLGFAIVGMMRSAVNMIPMVFSGRALAVETVVRLRLRHPVTRLLLCGALTLSPGTAVVRMSGDQLHILTLLMPGHNAVRAGGREARRLQVLLLRAERGP